MGAGQGQEDKFFAGGGMIRISGGAGCPGRGIKLRGNYSRARCRYASRTYLQYGGMVSIYPVPGYDLRCALRVAGIEIPPAFEDFEDESAAGQADQRGALGAELCDVERRVEGLFFAAYAEKYRSTTSP